jgi:hypothetical protein
MKNNAKNSERKQESNGYQQNCVKILDSFLILTFLQKALV